VARLFIFTAHVCRIRPKGRLILLRHDLRVKGRPSPLWAFGENQPIRSPNAHKGLGYEGLAPGVQIAEQTLRTP
jgi:hypothetical protein